eukprot:751873-Hanusia_phi.AAC.1
MSDMARGRRGESKERERGLMKSGGSGGGGMRRRRWFRKVEFSLSAFDTGKVRPQTQGGSSRLTGAMDCWGTESRTRASSGCSRKFCLLSS